MKDDAFALLVPWKHRKTQKVLVILPPNLTTHPSGVLAKQTWFFLKPRLHGFACICLMVNVLMLILAASGCCRWVRTPRESSGALLQQEGLGGLGSEFQCL